MSWKTEPEHELTPEEKAKEIVSIYLEYMPFKDRKLFYESINEKRECVEAMENVTAIQCATIYQVGITTALKHYGITSEYENQVLKELKKI